MPGKVDRSSYDFKLRIVLGRYPYAIAFDAGLGWFVSNSGKPQPDYRKYELYLCARGYACGMDDGQIARFMTAFHRKHRLKPISKERLAELRELCAKAREWSDKYERERQRRAQMKTSARILGLLENCEPLSPAEISRKLKQSGPEVKPQTVRRAVRRMWKSGSLEQPEPGKYQRSNSHLEQDGRHEPADSPDTAGPSLTQEQIQKILNKVERNRSANADLRQQYEQDLYIFRRNRDSGLVALQKYMRHFRRGSKRWEELEDVRLMWINDWGPKEPRYLPTDSLLERYSIDPYDPGDELEVPIDAADNPAVMPATDPNQEASDIPF